MDFDPEDYEKTSFDAILPAKELIRQIQEKNVHKEKISLVVDVGCGPGNTCKLIAEELSPDRIIGIDIDPQMIEFAKQNNRMENTEYYCQDISAPLDQWDEHLRQLCGKVSVVFSNYALHWVKDVEQTANNLAKLISTNGQLVVDVLYVGDIYRNLRPEARAQYEQWLSYPSEQQVVGRWLTAFKSAGLTRCDVKYWQPKCIYPKRIYFDEFIKWPIDWYKSFMKADAKPDVDVDQELKDLIIKKRVRRMTEKSIKGEELIEITQELWNFVVTR